MVTKKARKPTIEDVARESGVSRGTVSRVLNGGHWVSPEAAAAVEDAIRRTGYRVNPHARSLATARAGSVAFLLTETQDQLFADPNFAALMQGASEALAEHDLTLVLIMAGTPAEQRRAREFILGGHVDGALLMSSHAGLEDLLDPLVAAEIPLISCGLTLGYERRIGWVGSDDEAGARDAAAHLLDRGCTRIAHLAGPRDTSGGSGRLAGYRAELGEDFREDLVVEGDYGTDSGRAAMADLLRRDPAIDGVFAANDMMAAGALEALRAAGRSVPDEVAVVGFDDSPIAVRTSPELTTMRQSFDRISREMVRALVDVIDGQPPARVSIPTSLVVRGTA